MIADIVVDSNMGIVAKEKLRMRYAEIKITLM